MERWMAGWNQHAQMHRRLPLPRRCIWSVHNHDRPVDDDGVEAIFAFMEERKRRDAGRVRGCMSTDGNGRQFPEDGLFQEGRLVG